MSSGFQVYFGGSYFPPHVGHDEMLGALLTHPDVSRVHLVPTFQNPLKKIPTGLAPTPLFKRRLIQAWRDSLEVRQVIGLEKLCVEWSELEAERAAYTVDTLSNLKRGQDPQGKSEQPWVLAVGSDSLADLDRWKEIDRLLKSVNEVWVYPRGTRSEASFLGRVPVDLQKLTKWRLMIPEIRDVSSTQIRELLTISGSETVSSDLAALVLPEILELL